MKLFTIPANLDVQTKAGSRHVPIIYVHLCLEIIEILAKKRIFVWYTFVADEIKVYLICCAIS